MNKCVMCVIAGLIVLTACRKQLVENTSSLNVRVLVSGATANDVVETAAPIWKAVDFDINPNVSGFWQGLPARYNLTTKRYPLIVFLHGIGELGTTLSKINCCGLPRHLNLKTFPPNFYVGGVHYSFVVIAPQFRIKATAADVQSVINFAKTRWRIDATRVYVTGLSLGGGSAWNWSAVYGQNAAALVPVCAGRKPYSGLAASIASRNLPIWGLYSSKDEFVPVQWGIDFFTWIDAFNPAYASKTKLTIWNDATHDQTWARAYDALRKVDGLNIYQWMLMFKRAM